MALPPWTLGRHQGPARPGSEKSLTGRGSRQPSRCHCLHLQPLCSPWLVQLLQTTNNSPMNSKPQQIKMQSTKKGPLTKREDGGPSGGPAVGVPPPGDETCSLGAAQSSASLSLQPTVRMPSAPGLSTLTTSAGCGQGAGGGAAVTLVRGLDVGELQAASPLPRLCITRRFPHLLAREC